MDVLKSGYGGRKELTTNEVAEALGRKPSYIGSYLFENQKVHRRPRLQEGDFSPDGRTGRIREKPVRPGNDIKDRLQENARPPLEKELELHLLASRQRLLFRRDSAHRGREEEGRRPGGETLPSSRPPDELRELVQGIEGLQGRDSRRR